MSKPGVLGGVMDVVLGTRLSRRGSVGAVLEGPVQGHLKYRGLVDSSAFPKNVYARLKHDDAGGFLPLYSGTLDLSAFINALLRTSTDLFTDIFAEVLYSDLRAFIYPKVTLVTSDLRSIIVSSYQTSINLYVGISGTARVHTEALSYTSVLLATPFGFSILKRCLTKLPDLTGSIRGWAVSDLSVYSGIGFRGEAITYANIRGIGKGISDLNAYLGPTRIRDMLGELVTIQPSDIGALVVGYSPADLNSYILSIEPKELRAVGGGHLPEDIYANLLVIPPKDLPVFIRSGLSGMLDLLSSLTSTGYWVDMGGRIDAMYRNFSSIFAGIIVSIPKDIYARLYGWATSDLTVFILGEYTDSMYAYIKGISVGNLKDLVSFIRATTHVTIDVLVFVKGIISAHTTDKPYNYYLFTHPHRKFLVGSRGGLSIMTMDPIRGYFPDLSASVVAFQLYTSTFRAFIRPALRLSYDLSTSSFSVTKPLVINKLDLIFRNFSGLFAELNAFSAYKVLSCFIQGFVSTGTSTSVGAHWITSASISRAFLATNYGLFIPGPVIGVVRPITFVNNSSTPDLWAYVRSWAVSDLYSSISVWPYANLLASVVSLDLTHVAILAVLLQSFTLSDITADISSSGGFYDLFSSVISVGSVSTIGASINAYREVKGLRLIPVYTIPFLELRAFINPGGSCAPLSSYKDLLSFIRCSVSGAGSGDLYATIDSLSCISDIFSFIVGKKLTRIRVIDLYFNTRERLFCNLYGRIIGTRAYNNDMQASILGLFLSSDLTATIRPYIHRFRNLSDSSIIDIYKNEGTTASLYKKLRLYFSSGVSEYIYDPASGGVYSIDNKRWVLNLEEVTSTGSFFDRGINDRIKRINSIVNFNSTDEAVRSAIAMLVDLSTYDMQAVVSAVGGVYHLQAFVIGMSQDRVIDLSGSIVCV